MKMGKILLWFTLFALSACPAAPQYVDLPAERKGGGKVQCANLVYAGSKTSHCFSDRFLTRLATETRIQVEPHFRKVRLDNRDLCNFPFAVMTGEGDFTLTEKDRVQLRYYLTHGGFLLASASCSDPQWTRSFRAEFAKIFPGERLTPLSLKHPLFRSMIYTINSLATTHGLAGAAGAKLEAFQHKGRIALLFSADGLNDTAHAEGCCCCGGDEIENAEFINCNVLAYAICH